MLMDFCSILSHSILFNYIPLYSIMIQQSKHSFNMANISSNDSSKLTCTSCIQILNLCFRIPYCKTCSRQMNSRFKLLWLTLKWNMWKATEVTKAPHYMGFGSMDQTRSQCQWWRAKIFKVRFGFKIYHLK